MNLSKDNYINDSKEEGKRREREGKRGKKREKNDRKR